MVFLPVTDEYIFPIFIYNNMLIRCIVSTLACTVILCYQYFLMQLKTMRLKTMRLKQAQNHATQAASKSPD